MQPTDLPEMLLLGYRGLLKQRQNSEAAAGGGINVNYYVHSIWRKFSIDPTLGPTIYRQSMSGMCRPSTETMFSVIKTGEPF